MVGRITRPSTRNRSRARDRRGSDSGARPCFFLDASPNGASRLRSREASRVRSRSGRSSSSARSASRRAANAASTAERPSVVSRTITPRRSSGSGYALDVPARAEPVDPVGHGAARHQRLAEQAAGRQLVRRARAAQRRQHVELPLLDAVRGERLATGELQPAGQAADPAEDRDRGEVEVAALAAPGLEQLVHLVPHGRSLEPVENLDIKMKQRRHWIS